VIGDALRARRQAQHRTLRQVSTAANVSLGYLSEIERGQKEASSELLSSICDALGAQLSDVLRDVSDTLALAEQVPAVLLPAEQRGAGAAQAPAETAEPVTVPASSEADSARRESVLDGEVSVAVHREGPLRTTLRATRVPRVEASRREVVYAS
jgi:transcriptional regulator with XRE-family HTH domain